MLLLKPPLSKPPSLPSLSLPSQTSANDETALLAGLTDRPSTDLLLVGIVVVVVVVGIVGWVGDQSDDDVDDDESAFFSKSVLAPTTTASMGADVSIIVDAVVAVDIVVAVAVVDADAIIVVVVATEIAAVSAALL